MHGYCDVLCKTGVFLQKIIDKTKRLYYCVSAKPKDTEMLRHRIKRAAYTVRPAEVMAKRAENEKYIGYLDNVLALLNKQGTKVELKEVTPKGRKYIILNGKTSKDVHVTNSDITIKNFTANKYADVVVVFGENKDVKAKMTLLQLSLEHVAPRRIRNVNIYSR